MCFFSLKYCFWMKFKANTVSLHLAPNPLLKKKVMKSGSSLTSRQSKKCKICVQISKMNICLQLPLRSRLSGIFPNKFALRSSHQDTFFNIAVLHLWWNSLKNTGDGVQFLVNLHVTLTNFEPLLWKSYISSHH